MKKIICYIMFCMIFLSLTACEKQKGSSNTVDDIVNDRKESIDNSKLEGELMDKNDDTEVKENQEELPQEEYYLNDRGYIGMAEGTILCGYGTTEDNKLEYLGIMNSKCEFIPCGLKYSSSFSEFSAGYAFINYEDKHFMFIDKGGNVIYESPTDADYKVLCGGNGYYYVEKRISGFDINEITYWIVSADGFWKSVDFVSDIVAAEYSYQGNGILRLGAYIFVNMKDCIVYYTESDDKYNPRFVGFTENRELIWSHTTSYKGEIYITDVTGKTKQIATTGGWGYGKYGEGLIFVCDEYGLRQFIDLEGKMIIDLSQYEIIDFETGCQFQDGYAALHIKGKDGLHYLAIIDKSGTFMFEPIQFSDYTNYNGIGNYSQGYVTIFKEDSSVNFVNHSGKVFKIFSYEKGKMDCLGHLICVGDYVFDNCVMKFYDLEGNECPVKIVH